MIKQTLMPRDFHSSEVLATCITCASESSSSLSCTRHFFFQKSKIGLESSSTFSYIQSLCFVRETATYKCFSSEHNMLCLASSKLGKRSGNVESSKSCSFMKSYSTLHSFFRGDDPKNLYRSTSYKKDKDAENAYM